MSGLRRALTREARETFLPESLATEHDYGSPMSPGAASHRGPGTVPVQQTQQASSPHAPAGSAGGEGESSSAPPGYAEFVTSAVRSAMEPFLQNVAQVVGEQTAQIAQVSQRVDQLAGVVSQLSLNQASQVPVGGSPPRPPHGSPSPPRGFESSSDLSSLSGFGERPVVPPVEFLVLLRMEFRCMKAQGLLLQEQKNVRKMFSRRVRSGYLLCLCRIFRSGRSPDRKRFYVFLST